VYVDRWNKKTVLFTTNLVRGFLLLPFLISNLHVSLVYILTFLIAVTTQFFLPAESAIIPSLVPKKLLFSANAVFSLGIYGTTLLGYILSGPVILLLGRTATFIFLAVLFFLSTVFIFFINIQKKKVSSVSDRVVSSVIADAREIFSFINRVRKVMKALAMLTIAQAVIFMFAVLTPGYATTILKIQLESLSWILIAPAALGMGLGAIILGSVGKRFDRKWLSSIGFLITGVVFILFPFADKVSSHGFVKVINSYLPHTLNITILHIVVVMAAIIGLAISLVFITSNTIIQLETSESMRGRVYGFLNALIGAVSFLPVVMAGGLADLFGIARVITGFGIIMITLGITFLIFE
ncbi:MAG: MFS transporter, partial [Patescibacteria group bacterium]|nr:MFS transporter [Patescibacteria group bacterium]